MLLSINYPSWLSPEIIPGFPLLRWYGLMYIFAFGTAYFLFNFQIKAGELRCNNQKIMTGDDIVNFFFWSILGLLLGARIFSCLIYDSAAYYFTKPWLIFWPFDKYMNFTGLAGMSYHGGFIGGLLGMILWTRKYKFEILPILDIMAASIPLGYTFGRLGNFLNGELYGRITTSPIGMIFPQVPPHERFSAGEEWVQSFAEKINMVIPAGSQFVNLPRHPSQLYEAFFEGIILWLIIWLCRKHKPFHGFLTGMYIIGYGAFRFIIEYFRQPDFDIGYRFSTNTGNPIYKFDSVLNISTGQILCLIMILGGTGLLTFFALKNKGKKIPEIQNETEKITLKNKTK
ncbi:MAG: prolipoprotein diacylglyceryl transferase [Treponema sp.]|nr:MAG: prolipoprotein diacylglyceryl transferase [Treponema sp.]